MPRIFGHYVSSSVLVLILTQAVITFGSVFVGLALPLVGLPAVRPAWGSAFPAAVLLAWTLVATAHVAGFYDIRQGYGKRELFLRLGVASISAYVALAILGYVIQSLALGRMAFAMSWLTAFPAIFVARLLHDRFTSDSQRRRKVLLLGSGRTSRLIASAIRESKQSYELTGCLEGGPKLSQEDDDELRSLGTIDDLDWIAKVTRPDVIVVALEERRGTLPVAEIVECKLRGIEVEDWPGFYEKLTGKIPLNNLRPSWLVFADGFSPARLTLATKRAIDLVAAFFGCLVLSPIMAAVAVAIRFDSPGPVFFRQERTGQFGRVFQVFKFRSMRVDAALMPAPLPGEPDPRVTRVGHLLRRTRIDELPQLFNVLLGDMSLVGPRPEWVALVPEFSEKVPLYLHRLAAKPGITGWAQVNNPYGASVENTLEKLQYDLYYIKNMSIFLDLLILLHTVQIVLFTRGSGAWTSKNHQSTTSVSYAA
jgi:sugar transferase (PEP-CTERM system associated)